MNPIHSYTFTHSPRCHSHPKVRNVKAVQHKLWPWQDTSSKMKTDNWVALEAVLKS